jgi:hypothetical protein
MGTLDGAAQRRKQPPDLGKIRRKQRGGMNKIQINFLIELI